MAGSGSVGHLGRAGVCVTMGSMAISPLKSAGQAGTTIALGLLFDTLVVRSFMTPSIAALMGKWFWWPQRVRQRPVPQPWPSPSPDSAFGTTGFRLDRSDDGDLRVGPTRCDGHLVFGTSSAAVTPSAARL